MLVLTRKEGEQIEIDYGGQANIVVTVVKTGHNKVRLGFTAPEEVNILRKELAKYEPDPVPPASVK